MPKYAGSDWIKSALKVKMSPLGEAVADLLGDLFFGIYHLDTKALRRVDWANDNHIVFSLGWHSLSTCDFDELTRLVILCHDRAIRCSVAASTHKYLELMFHQRQRDGGYSERHPTIEQAIEETRKAYQ
jgi:hypothetical protein